MNQRGDVGIGMVVLMVIMMAGLFWWGGMHHGDGHTRGPQQAMEVEKTPIELLNQAYARGEITREEYLQRRSELTHR